MALLAAKADLDPFQNFESATRHLEMTAKRAGVRHLSYWFMQFSGGFPDHVVWVATYDPQYMNHYMKTFTPLGDPVIEKLIEDDVVIDWNEWTATGVDKDIRESAATYGITHFGISLPLKLDSGDKAIFSVNANSDDAHWPAQRGILAKRFRPFAQEFHLRMKPMIAARHVGEAVYSF